MFNTLTFSCARSNALNAEINILSFRLIIHLMVWFDLRALLKQPLLKSHHIHTSGAAIELALNHVFKLGIGFFSVSRRKQ